MRDAATTVDLPQRAKALVPLLAEHAQAAEEQQSLTTEVVEALHREGLFGIWVPQALGGSELDPVPSLEVIEQLAYGDPSAGWVLMAAGLAIGTGGAYLGDEAVAQLFGGERFPVIVGQGTRPGTAVPQEGGFLLSGAWSFASGIRHATHIHTLAVIEGTGEPRIFVLPVEEAILIDNWDVVGLRATASIDYTIDSVFVPEAFTHFATTEASHRGGYLYTMGIPGFAAICHTAWALGLGRRMLDELSGLVQSEAGRPDAQSESGAFLQQFAEAEATYRAARALVFEIWNDVQATLQRDERMSVRQHTLIRLVATHVTWAVHDVGMFVHTAGGTTALRAGPIERLFRDLHAGSQHMIVAPAGQQAVGRELAGVAAGKTWRFLELVDG